MVKKKVAVLGGGIAAMSAAFQLTNTERWQDDLEVTVYQIGWRLGGKCATSRNPDVRDRIEEHGIHYLLGFYENAFHVIRQVYDESQARSLPLPFPTWQEAFRNQTSITAMVDEGGRFTPFGTVWPMRDDLPGDPARFARGEHPPVGWGLLQLLLCRVAEWAVSLLTDPRLELSLPQTLIVQQIASWLKAACAIADPFRDPPNAFVIHKLITLLDRATKAMLDSSVDPMPALNKADKPSLSDFARYMLLTLDVGCAIARGMLADDLTAGDFRTVDHLEFRTWLRKHGCRHPDFAVIRSGYDACFAYIGGDPDRRTMSAAVALNGGLRLWLTYRGSIFWPMRAGMAEIIFAPLYRLLKARGVTFKFFNRVQALHLSADKKSIDKIAIDVQAKLKSGVPEYDPLIQVKKIDCWPNTPLYDQLANPGPLKGKDMESAWNAPDPVGQEMLQRGRDFDDVVFGIALGAVPFLCKELVDARTDWQTMVRETPTVQTQALQIWMHLTSTQCGYDLGTLMPMPSGDFPCLSAFVKPFDTYVDQTELREREGWLPEDNVRHLAYFCTTLQDDANIPPPGNNPQFVINQQRRVRDAALTFITRDLRLLFPTVNKGVGAFNWDLLVDLSGGKGSARLDAQFMRPNIDPSGRYVISPPGTMSVRLQPDGSGFTNLFLAGDWTFTPMNSGCVEAAAMSGLRAAAAISGKRVHIYGWRT